MIKGLQFQKRIPSEKELIFQFHVITYVEKEHEGKLVTLPNYEGEVIVNLTTRMYHTSEKVWELFRNNIHEEGNFDLNYHEETKNMKFDKKMAFLSDKVNEEIEKRLFDECEKLSKVIC